jgi:hypothetical protein
MKASVQMARTKAPSTVPTIVAHHKPRPDARPATVGHDIGHLRLRAESELARRWTSGGRSLSPAERSAMEPLFGADFGHVRLHTDSEAAALARAQRARAFTVGSHIVFGGGCYAPDTMAGRQLLAHELAHVAQHRSTPDAPVTEPSPLRRQAESEARHAAVAVPAGHAMSISTRVAPRTILRQGDEETIATPSSEEESPGFWGTIGGGLMGEFNEDPGFAMIGVDVGVSLIPILDQASDLRDIIAHLYYLIVRRQYDRFMRWLGLVFTLIGLIPEVGSAIKGASKFVIRGVEVVISHLGDLLRPLTRLFPEIVDLGRLHRYIARNWTSLVGQATAAWTRTATRVTQLVSMIPTWVGGRFRLLREGWARIMELAPRKLDEAFDWVRRKFDEVFTAVEERLGIGGPRLVPAGAGGPGSMHMSSLGDEWRGPRSTGEAIDELEDTLRGSRATDPRDVGRMAEAGRRIEPGAVADWARRLGDRWQVLTRDGWPAWLRRRFPSGGPDMVAINRAEQRIIVGDVAPSAASRVDVRPGTGRGAPASARRPGESAVVRAGDEGTMGHIEKTLDDARRVADGLPAEMRDFQVFAQEYYWEAGQRLSRLIQVYP